jgi:hypothetical protein
MWLLRTGLVQFKDIKPESLANFIFSYNSEDLTSLDPLKAGDLVEIRLKEPPKPEL